MLTTEVPNVLAGTWTKFRARYSNLGPTGTARGAALQLGGGTAIGQALVLLSAPVVTRLYSPADMGLFGVFSAYILFASVVVALRFDMAIVPARTDGEADRLLIIACLTSLLMSVVGGVVLAALIRRRLLSYGGLPIEAAWVGVALLAGTGLFSVVRYWVIRAQEFGQLARAAVVQGLGRAILPIAAAAASVGWWGLAAGELAGRVLGTGPLARAAWPRVRETLRRDDLPDYKRTASANWRYPAIVAPSALLDALGAALLIPVVATVFGVAAAGQLVIVQRIAAIPASLIGASVADVFHARISEESRRNPRGMRGMVLRTVRHLLLVAIGIYVPLGIVSALAFRFVFGSSWITAGWLVALFTPLNIATLSIGPVTRLYFVVNRPELKLLFDVGFICIPLVSIGFLHAHGVGFWWCMATYIGLATLAFVVHLALTLWAASLPPRHAPHTP